MKSIRQALVCAPALGAAPPVVRRGAVLALVGLLACGDAGPPTPPEVSPAPAAPLTGPSPAARSLEIRGALEDARTMWEGGERDAARDRVLVAYQRSFEPMEPLLTSIDPAGTLQIEFAFGALAAQLSRKSDALSVQTAISELTGRIDAAVKAIPADKLPPEATQAEQLLGPPPVVLEGRPPRRDATRYGDAEPN